MRQGWVLGCFLLVAVMTTGCQKEGSVSTPKAVPVREDGQLELKLATFNIRNENNGDLGTRAWVQRVANAVRLIRRMEPDVIGLQELTHGQAADLRASLPDYEFFGKAREDGLRKGEYAGIFYRADRFALDSSQAGTFWLSGTPEKPGSATFGNTLPRIATWLRLVDRSTNRGFYVFNTHFDHRHQGSREAAALLLASRIDARKNKSEPVVVLGDFNAVESNPALVYLSGKPGQVAGSANRWKNGLLDTFQLTHPGEKNRRTLHLWRGNTGESGWKVDHILVSEKAKVMEAAIVVDPLPFSSDHFPVSARVIFP